MLVSPSNWKLGRLGMGFTQFFVNTWQLFQGWAINAVGRIGVTDIIDMLIIAFLIYKLLKFLRKSRLGMIARSILLLVVVVWLSGQLNLMVINFATSRALEMGILALVILFQPEIRQSLERLGKANISLFSKDNSAEDMEEVIDQTVEACLQMAKDRTGALIVFQREMSLEDETKTGTRLDAKLSIELLLNIFYDKAPLHDGAVIIKAGRVVSGGCVLPLSDNVSLARELGMRHRAGIGVSEKSDAVAVMVSEESGAISVAVAGNLHRYLAKDTLENLLRNELIEKEEQKASSVLIKLLGGKKS